MQKPRPGGKTAASVGMRTKNGTGDVEKKMGGMRAGTDTGKAGRRTGNTGTRRTRGRKSVGGTMTTAEIRNVTGGST